MLHAVQVTSIKHGAVKVRRVVVGDKATAPSAGALFNLTTSCFHRSSVRIALAVNVLYTPRVCETHILLSSRSSVNERS